MKNTKRKNRISLDAPSSGSALGSKDPSLSPQTAPADASVAPTDTEHPTLPQSESHSCGLSESRIIASENNFAGNKATNDVHADRRDKKSKTASTLPEKDAKVIAAYTEKLSGTLAPKKKKKSSIVIKTVGLLAIFAISIYILATLSNEFGGSEEQLSFGALCAKIGWKFWVVIIVLFVLMVFLQTVKFAYMNKISFGKFRFALGFKVNLIGKFYDNITPMSTGGQPFQMYYLHKNGVDIGNATSIPTMNYVIQMYAWQLVSLIMLTVNGNVLFAADAKSAVVISTMCWIGWSINMVVPILLLSFAFAPKFAYALFRGLIKVGKKLHLVKNYDKTLSRAYASIDSYRKELFLMGKKIGHIAVMMLISIVEFLVLLSIPLVLTHFIVDTPLTFVNWANMATLHLYTIYSVTFLPTPGASGFAETVSSLAFAGVATPGTLFWLLMLMRFFTYYIFIILGLLVTLYDVILGSVRGRVANRNNLKAHGNARFDPSETSAVSAYESEDALNSALCLDSSPAPESNTAAPVKKPPPETETKQ